MSTTRTLGPAVDGGLRTSRPEVFAAGNVLHPADVAEEPLRWISPSAHRPGDRGPARGRLLARVDEYVPFPKVTITQDGRTIAERRLAPGRVFRIPGRMLDTGDVHISLRR